MKVVKLFVTCDHRIMYNRNEATDVTLFLTQNEICRLQGAYETWLDYIDTEALTTAAFTNSLLQHHQLEAIESTRVTREKNKLLWTYLLRGKTFDDVTTRSEKAHEPKLEREMRKIDKRTKCCPA